MPVLDLFIMSYNRAAYIGEALDSVFAQTFQDFRVVVLDNASTDNTAEVVAAYERVEFVSAPENMGFYKSFLRIKELASAKWVMAFHDDDIMHPAFLETLLNRMENMPNCMVGGSNFADFRSRDDLGPTKELGSDAWVQNNAAELAAHSMATGRVSFPSCIYRREAFLTLREDGMPELGKICDRPIMIDICGEGTAVILKDPYIHYRTHDQQDSKTESTGPYADEIIALHAYYKAYMGTDWSSDLGKVFVLYSPISMKRIYRWCGDQSSMSLRVFLRKAYRAGASTRSVFVPRPFLRMVQKLYRSRFSRYF